MTNFTCPSCGAKERVHDDTFSYRCPQCSRIVSVPHEEVEKTTSFYIKRKKPKPKPTPEPPPEPIEPPEESLTLEDYV
jgi:DNA-directed RNA polymerase subunit RPC12/RpoP